MHLDIGFGNFKSSSQKVKHFLALIALELQDVSKFLVFVDVAIATEFFLESLQDTLQIVLAGNTLDGGDRLTAIALLAANVDLVSNLGFGITTLGKRIERTEVVKGGHKLLGC